MKAHQVLVMAAVVLPVTLVAVLVTAGFGDARWPGAAAIAGRFVVFVGLALAFGAAAWLWSVRAELDGMRGSALKALVLGATVHSLGILLLLKATTDSTGLSPSALAASEVGRLLAFRLVAGLAALVLAGLALLPRNPARLGAPLAAAIMVAAGIGSSASGRAAEQGLPGMAVDAMHLLASTTWVGGLLLFFVALGHAARLGLPADAVRRIGLRFSTVALMCVIVLFLAGSATTLVILGREALLDPIGLSEGRYGRFLLAKVALALLMVALAAANRYVFLDPAKGMDRTDLKASVAALGPDGTAKGLRRTVAVEAGVGVTVLALAAFLSAISPTMAPLHDGHDGGGAFDAYNLTILVVVLAILGVVGFVLFKVAKRRRGE